MPSNMSGCGTQWKPGTGVSGQASSQRTRSASTPPITSMLSPVVRNCLPIVLWSSEKMYLRMKPGSACAAARWRASA